MLIVPLIVSLKLAASVAPLLPSGHWMPVAAMHHPYETVTTSDPSGDAGAWSLQHGARITAEVGLKASRIVNELREEGGADRPGAVAGFTDETVDLASKADAVPVAAIADEGGSVLGKVARHAVKFKAVIVLLIGAVGAVGAVGKLSTGSTNQDESKGSSETTHAPA